MKLALFKTNYGYLVPLKEWADFFTGYTRVSEFIDVEFPPLPGNELAERQIFALNEEIKKISEEYANCKKLLIDKKEELAKLKGE